MYHHMPFVRNCDAELTTKTLSNNLPLTLMQYLAITFASDLFFTFNYYL